MRPNAPGVEDAEHGIGVSKIDRSIVAPTKHAVRNTELADRD